MADAGSASAQFNLGVMYANGTGVAQDYPAAAGWFRKAADQGNALAQNNLGVMYDKGQGVAQDYAAAVSWYRKQVAFDIAERWPSDVIPSEEIDAAMGEERPRGAAKRYMLERAGLIRLRTFKVQTPGVWRTKVTAYAVRNSAAWKSADITALRAEIARADSAAKEAALYGHMPTTAAAVDDG